MQLLEWVHQNFRLRRSSIRMRFMLRLRVVSISVRLEEISRSCALNPCRDLNAFFKKGFEEYIRRGFYRALCSLISMFLGLFLWFVFLLYNILNHVMIADCATLYNIRSILLINVLNHRA